MGRDVHLRSHPYPLPPTVPPLDPEDPLRTATARLRNVRYHSTREDGPQTPDTHNPRRTPTPCPQGLVRSSPRNLSLGVVYTSSPTTPTQTRPGTFDGRREGVGSDYQDRDRESLLGLSPTWNSSSSLTTGTRGCRGRCGATRRTSPGSTCSSTHPEREVGRDRPTESQGRAGPPHECPLGPVGNLVSRTSTHPSVDRPHTAPGPPKTVPPPRRCPRRFPSSDKAPNTAQTTHDYRILRRSVVSDPTSPPPAPCLTRDPRTRHFSVDDLPLSPGPKGPTVVFRLIFIRRTTPTVPPQPRRPRPSPRPESLCKGPWRGVS